jgi:hypothetical protein
MSACVDWNIPKRVALTTPRSAGSSFFGNGKTSLREGNDRIPGNWLSCLTVFTLYRASVLSVFGAGAITYEFGKSGRNRIAGATLSV